MKNFIFNSEAYQALTFFKVLQIKLFKILITINFPRFTGVTYFINSLSSIISSAHSYRKYFPN